MNDRMWQICKWANYEWSADWLVLSLPAGRASAAMRRGLVRKMLQTCGGTAVRFQNRSGGSSVRVKENWTEFEKDFSQKSNRGQNCVIEGEKAAPGYPAELILHSCSFSKEWQEAQITSWIAHFLKAGWGRVDWENGSHYKPTCHNTCCSS